MIQTDDAIQEQQKKSCSFCENPESVLKSQKSSCYKKNVFWKSLAIPQKNKRKSYHVI